jgi:hypothetical protein
MKSIIRSLVFFSVIAIAFSQPSIIRQEMMQGKEFQLGDRDFLPKRSQNQIEGILYLIDSIKIHSIKNEDLKYSFLYDSNTNRITWIVEKWQNNQWDSITLNLFQYNIKGNILVYLIMLRNNNQWNNSEKYLYTYDNQNNILSEIQMYWKDSIWVNIYRLVKEYDYKGNIIRETRQEGGGKNWYDKIISDYTYNEKGNEYTVIIKDCYYGTWQFRYKYMCIIDSNKRLTHISSFRFVYDWELTSSMDYIYDDKGNIVSSEYYDWKQRDDHTWIYKNTYDKNGNLLICLNKNKYSKDYTNRYSCSYDDNNNLLTRLNEKWDTDKWVIENVDFDFLDSKGNKFTFDAYRIDVFYKQPTPVQDNSPYTSSNITIYPNPNDSKATIEFEVKKPGNISISLYNKLGELVRTIANNSHFSEGIQKIEINTQDLPPAAYFLKITEGSKISTTKIFIKE